MRVLILADTLFASRERSLLARLEVGLADEGVRVLQAVPRQVVLRSPPGVVARTIAYTPRAFVLTRGLAVRRIARDVERALQDGSGGGGGDVGGDGIDLIHVFGGSAWRLGRDLASELGCPLAVEVWRYGLCARAAEWGGKPRNAPTLLAPDGTIERHLRKLAPRARVFAAPWGVLPADARDILRDGRSPSMMMVGTGRDAGAFCAALRGAAPVLREHPDAIVFCDAQAARKADLWSEARRLGVLDRLSLIEDLEGRRDLLLQGDILVVPEAHGEQRSIVLEAMAHGVVVAAARDPQVSMLVEGRSARLVDGPVAQQWSAVLGDLLADRQRTRLLAQGAQQFVRHHRRASDHVRAVMAAYTPTLAQPARQTGNV